MSQLDDKYLKPGVYWIPGQGWTTAKNHNQSVRNTSIDEYIAGIDVNVHNRNDIINPTDILNNYDFGNSREERLKYNEYLEALKALQQQQTAAYEEWYNSPVEQVKRDREAGLNTDLLGVSGSEAASTQLSSENPNAGIPTNGEQFVNATSAIGSLVGSIASMASLPTMFAQMSQTKELTNQLKLSNLKEFESLVGGEVSSRLSDAINTAISAGNSLDIAEWFSIEENTADIFESYAPEDSPRYRRAFANVRQRMQQNLGKAYEQGKVTAENQGSFASLVADPTYSADQLIQIAQLRPYMQAVRDVQAARARYEKALSDWKLEYQNGLDVNTAVEAANSKSQYDSDYWSNFSGVESAARDAYIKEAESIKARMQGAIDKHLLEIYDGNQNNMKGFSAAYVFSGGASQKWGEYFGTFALAHLQDIAELPTLYDENGVPHIPSKDGGYVPLGAPSDFDSRTTFGNYK